MNTKSLLIKVGAPAVLALGLLGAAGPAFASTGPGAGQTSHMTGNTAKPYSDPVFGNVQCNETQHPAHGKQLAFDTVNCTFTDGPRTDLAGLNYAPGANSWISDFDHATYGSINVTVSPDGTGYSGQATYPAPPAA